MTAAVMGWHATVQGTVRTLLRLAVVVVVAAIGLAGIVVAAVPPLARVVTSPELKAGPLPALTPLSRASLVYDAAGNLIDRLNVENIQPFTLDRVPKDVVTAVLAVEDAGFYEHRGVNAKGLIRAGLANVSAGGTTQGGSTITQQLVKNALVGSKRDANRKILEASYAVELEKKLTKDQILEEYLNRIYLGNNAYGLQAAAQTYFGKDVEQLDLVEGAFLAGMIRNPAGYDPIYRSERSRLRFKESLTRLVKVGRLAQSEADRVGSSWLLPDRIQRGVKVDVARTYFSAEVRQQLLNKTTILGSDYQTRYNQMFRGGLKIYTTLDPRLQQAAEDARSSDKGQLPDTAGRFQAAIVSLDNSSGAIRAMVGGPGFDSTQVNLATTGRQTGSAGKAFILTAALAAGVQSNDYVDGSAGRNCEWWSKGPPSDTNPYTQQNVEFEAGPLERMTWNSVNCAFIRLYLSVGGPRVVAMAHNMGVKGPLKDIYSFATGGNAISPLDMAAGFSTLANLGTQRDPYYIDRIEDGDGRVIYQHEVQNNPALDPAVAARAVDILKGVLRQGTATRGKLADDRPAAGKTGTYEKNLHAWFVGFTPQYTTSVYLGNPALPEPMDDIPEFTGAKAPQQAFNRVQGGTYPTLIWKQYMDAIHEGLEPLDWPAPEANARGPMRVYAPGQDCIGAVVGSDEEGFSLVPGKQPAYVTPDPNDFAAPAATVPMSQRTYNCHYKGGFISGPKPTTTIAGDPAAPGAPAPAPGAGPAPTAAPTPPTKKP